MQVGEWRQFVTATGYANGVPVFATWTVSEEAEGHLLAFAMHCKQLQRVLTTAGVPVAEINWSGGMAWCPA